VLAFDVLAQFAVIFSKPINMTSIFLIACCLPLPTQSAMTQKD
jgi:hypothetical protein